MADCHNYLSLAATCLAQRHPALIITHGLPGCGKTTISQTASERFSAIHIRSDVERKRLFGLAPLQSSRSGMGSGIYTADATQRTYVRLHELARSLLGAGFPVIVDAAFLKHAEREQFRHLAREMGVPFVILDIQASTDTLRRRILKRQKQARDASEADLAVLEALQSIQEPLSGQELACSVKFVNEDDINRLSAWNALAQMTAQA